MQAVLGNHELFEAQFCENALGIEHTAAETIRKALELYARDLERKINTLNYFYAMSEADN
jgi:low affinity Fe/Cu permease